MKFSEMPYERIGFEKLKESFRELSDRFERAESGEEQFQVHQDYYRITEHVMTEMTIAMIRNDIDMTDAFYSEEQKHYDRNMPVFQSLVCLLYTSDAADD